MPPRRWDALVADALMRRALGEDTIMSVAEMYRMAMAMEPCLPRAQLLWVTCVCGDSRAPFDLYEVFYAGQGVPVNAELALVFYSTAGRCARLSPEEVAAGAPVRDGRAAMHEKFPREILTHHRQVAYRLHDVIVVAEGMCVTSRWQSLWHYVMCATAPRSMLVAGT
jgi:hypothetical protein